MRDEDVEATVSSTGADDAPAGAPAGALRGTTIGRFLVLGARGEGGMGRIYEAYDPELDRKVAIKLVRADRISARGAAVEGERLLREAQAMAKVAHPNVVSVFEVGSLDDQIFVAMELVDGPNLAAWLATGRRGWREVIDLFVAAGRGLAATHAAGLVHRDFKPANVVVSAGGAKVLDFGLAIAGDAAPSGEIAGTPRYMAPEQREGRADARADQYSFCSALDDALTRGAGAPPRAVRRVLARGLRADPARRFASMTALLDALSRARRRRTWIAGVALAAVAATTGAVFVMRGGGEPPCADGRARLAGVWDGPVTLRAQRAFAGVRGGGAAFGHVRAALDGYADAWVDVRDEACRATEVRHEQSAELLDLRMACLDERKAELGAFAEQLAQVDAGSLPALVVAAGKLTSLTECSAAASLHAPEPLRDPFAGPTVATIRGEIGVAHALALAGKHGAAASLVTAQVARARALGWRPLLAETQYEQGVVALQADLFADAQASLFDSLWNAEASRHDRLAAQCWIELVQIVQTEDNGFDRAEAWATRADAALARIGGDVDLTALLTDLRASIADSQGRYADAKAGWMRARVLVAASHPDDLEALAGFDNHLAMVAKYTGDFAEAERLFRRAIAGYERVYGPSHPAVAGMLINLAALLDERGDSDGALVAIRRAISIYDAEPGVNLRWRAIAEERLADVMHSKGDYDAMLPALDRALADLTASVGPDDLAISGVLVDRSIVDRKRGHGDAGLAELQRAFAIAERRTSPDDPRPNMIRISLGEAYLQLRDPAAARHVLEPARALFDKIQPDGIIAAFARFTLARALLAQGDAAGARPLVEQALAFREKTSTPEQLAETRLLLAETLWDVDRKRARALIELARPVIDPQPYDPDLDLATWERTHPDR